MEEGNGRGAEDEVVVVKSQKLKVKSQKSTITKQ
jgi:hypothetical protein